MLRIRLTRVGRKNLPHYRIVVAEHTEPVKGKFIEILGNYSPLTKATVLDKDKALAWMNKGAKPSNMVAKILKRQGLKHKSIVIEEYHKKPKNEVKKTETPKIAEAPTPENKPTETPVDVAKPVETEKPSEMPMEKAAKIEKPTVTEKPAEPIKKETQENNKDNKSDVSSQGQPTA